MINALLAFGLTVSVGGGIIAVIAQSRPASSPTERWATRAMVLFALTAVFNTGAALAFPSVGWVRILGSIVGMGFTLIAMVAVWHMHRRTKTLRAKADGA